MKYLNIITIITFLFLTSNSVSAQCIDDSHSPFQSQGWLSCQKSESSIPERGINHWIKYDFKHVYQLIDMQIWNHNVWGETGMGAQSIIIDYSIDNGSWTTIGPIEVSQAPGSWKYVSDNVVDLSDVVCRYMLITVINPWDNTSDCAGLGEIKINVDQVLPNEEILTGNYNVYPNPASDILNIELENITEITSIAIYNSVGMEILTLPLPTKNKISLPVWEFTGGVYFLKIANEQGIISKSFVKI